MPEQAIGEYRMNDSYDLQRRQSDDLLLSVVMPVYNEADVLPTLLDSVTDSLVACGADYEIIFVNDGSSDASERILDSFAAGEDRVRVIHLARNFGHQAAVQAGLAHARGDAVVLMDSDMQDAPEAIPRFLERWRAGYDVVYALRTDRKENPVKRFLFSAFHRLMSRMANVPIPADAGIFGLVDRRIVDRIVAMGETDRYFPGLRSWAGSRQTGIEVTRNARYDDEPRVSIFGLIRLAKTAIFSFSTFPLTVFYVIGGLAGLLFVMLGGYSIFCRLFTDLAIPGWTSHVLIGSFFGALNAMGICILGEYVVRIYDQVRDRPLYLVDRRVNAQPECEFSDKDGDYDGLFNDLLEEAAGLIDLGTIRDDALEPTSSDESPPEPVILSIGEEGEDERPF
jgi:polyisoprenyl-phosphate glycosyltransferase